MRFAAYRKGQESGLAVALSDGRFHGLLSSQPGFPGPLESLIGRGEDGLKAGADALSRGAPVDLAETTLLPPLAHPGKIICVGLNYADHSAESGFEVPSYPTIFARFASSLIAHDAPIIRPTLSDQLDYEGELVAVIGKPGRHIPKDRALAHVIGYSIFNDASIRDYQRKAPQWTMGKNFDATGAFGPVFVDMGELPPGAKGLRLQTRLNGQIVQDGATDDMIFDVASLVSIVSDVLTLSPGDIIVTGTPSGVGAARKPPLFMKPGDVCEVEIEGIGILRNPIVQE
jgi:acylpyruvate hydrolase